MSGEDKPTEYFEVMRWLAPVETLEQLHASPAREGQLCFVARENAVFRFEGGVWRLEAKADE